MSTYYTEAEWLACLLQKKYRLRKRNLREYIAATCIQKRVRGFLFRISEKYVLSRVYAAIPWFWKQIIDRGREEEGGKTPVLESSSPVTHRQIRDLIYQTRDTLAGKKLKPDQTTPPVIATLPFGVLGNSFGERKKRVILHHDSPHLQSSPQSRSTRRMQFWLPSAFDLAPYASLADGRHIPLYGGNKRGHTSNSSSLHTFPLHLWPRQQKSYEQVETPFDIFDPHEFTFDIHEQSRGVLMCVRCEKRFRMITCVTCGSRGFCFQCALRIHSGKAFRHHDMKFVDPKVATTRVTEHSLVYHVDIANHMAQDLRHIIKSLQNKGEVQRVRKEKALKAEMEKEEKRMKEAQSKAQIEDRQRHAAASRIASLLHLRRARHTVDMKRVQVRLRELLLQERDLHARATTIQRSFRLFSSRHIAHNRLHHSSKTKTVKELLVSERVIYDIQQRRICERQMLLTEMKSRRAVLSQSHQTNIDLWLQRNAKITVKIARLQARLADLDLVYQGIVAPHIVAAHGTEDSSESAKSFVPLGSSKRRSRKQQRGSKVAQMANTAEPMVLTLTLEEEAEKQLRLKDIRATKASLEYILANYLRIKKWIAQCVRANCRRLSLIKERFLDTTSRLAWLAREHAMVSRVLFHIDYRLQRGAISSELLMPMEWLTAHRAFTCDVLNALDAQHESLLLEEISKLKADSDNLSDQDRMLQGMQESIHLDIQYTAEKIYLDKALLRVVKGSDESVLLSDRAYHIKKKQLQLISHVIDALSLALHERFNAEDDATMFIAAFPSDDPSLGVESMLPTISAVLHEKFQPPVNFHVIQFMRVYLVQPWLSHQAVADVRIEDEVVSLEIRLESDQTEYGLLGEKIVSMEEGIKLIDEQILELNDELSIQEIEPKKGYFTQEADELVGEVIRKETIALLELEKKTKFQMKDTETAKLANLRNLAVGMEQRIREATNSLKSKQETLTKHAEDRHNSQEQFLQIESNLATDLVRLLSHTSECYRRQLAHNKELLALCDHFFTTENDWVERCKEGKLTLEELDSLLLTKGSYHLDWNIRSCHAILSPRLCGAAEDVENSFLEVRLIELNLNQKLYKFKLEQLELELEAFLNFDSTRKTCVDVLGHFQHRLLRQRKQRSLQKELEERRLRLEDMRGLRLKTMRRDREALNLKKLQEQKLREKKFAKELNDSKTVRQVNKLRKQAQELRRNMIAALLGIEAPPDEETGRMMDALAEFSADNMEDRPRALRKLKFTVGEVETSYFSRQMAMLAEKKLPHFIKHPKSIGRQVSLWFQTTYDAEHFITAVDIGHATKESRLHKNLTSSGYEAVEHSGLKIVIWVKRDSSKLSAVSAVDFGFSEAEEQMFEMEGMEMIGPNLFEFDLPDSSLWLKRIDKVMNKPSKASSAVATNSAISQLQKVREFLVENPASQKMLDMEQRLIEDLKICYKKEEESGIDDPIKASKRLMALDENELDGWLDCFERLDGEKEGRINVKLIFRALGEKATEAGLEIFRSMHGIDEDGNLEFGDFILSVGTFCFFGEADVLKFLYNFADVTKRGVITHAEYIDLLNDLHPLDKARAIRTLKRMQRALTDIVSFESFVETHKTFPAMLFPFFQLQKALRKHFMGEAWWMHKLTKYQATREKLTMEAESMDWKAEAELRAFDENEEREKRTEQRAKAILQETSAIKLALLNARQFADALK